MTSGQLRAGWTFALLVALATGSRAAPPLVVNNLHDDGPGSLRRAVELANRTPGADTVTIAPGLSGTIVLSGGPIRVRSEMAVLGRDATALAVSGGAAGRVFEVLDGGDLRLAKVTVRDGRAAIGAGLYVGRGGNAAVTGCAFADNEATDGGAIFADRASLTVDDSLFTGNLAVHGASVHASHSSLAVRGSAFYNNRAYYAASGVFVLGTPAVVDRCAFVGNQSADGAIALTETPGGRSRVTNTLVAANFTPGTGAILLFSNAHADIVNCTVVGNTGGILTGSGISALLGVSGPSTATISNSIVWGNTSFAGPVPQIVGLGGSSGLVRASDVEGPIGPEFATDGVLSVDPLFVRNPNPAAFPPDPGDLRLAAGSPCVDAGISALVPAGLTGDLDGGPRIVGAAVDLGAYERGSTPAGGSTPAYPHGAPVTIPGPAAPPAGGPGGGVGKAKMIVVSSLRDDGPGSLRRAVDLANRTPGADTVAFAPGLSGTIALTTGQITVESEITIEGPGAGAVAVSGGGVSRVFEAAPGVGLRLSGLTVRNGAATLGAGLLVGPGARVEVADCVFAGNVADAEGGGIYSYRARLSVARSTFAENAALDGGGIYPDATEFTVTGSTFAGNRVFYGGSGVFVFGAPARVDRCAFLGNQSADAALSFTHTPVAGGAAGRSLVTNCVVAGNITPGAGAILAASLADADIVNCTVTGNVGGVISGAGITALTGITGPSVTTVSNSIVWGNRSFVPAPFVPSQIVSFSIPIQVSYSDVEVGTVETFSGLTVVPGEGNINADPLFVRAPNLFGAQPDLGDLRLRAGSPCLDAASLALLPPGVTLDLNGGPRVLGPGIDMGAYEGSGVP